MSRRTWIVLLIVVAVLAIAPHLPEWWPALVGAVRGFDPAGAERSMIAIGARGMVLLNEGVAFTRARPQLIFGAGAGVVVAILVAGVRHLLRRLAPAVTRAAPGITVMPSEPLLPAEPVAAPAARASHRQERTALAPTTLQAAEPSSAVSRRTAAPGRGQIVRRLSAAGHSTAEISRATHVGQDAVRLVLLREALS